VNENSLEPQRRVRIPLRLRTWIIVITNEGSLDLNQWTRTSYKCHKTQSQTVSNGQIRIFAA